MKSLHSKMVVKNAVLHYGKKKIPLLSGEFHYWRVSHENWEAIADKILELGLNMAATYVPWNYHELSEGVYDFTGKTSPQRNLDGFLSLMERKGLYVMIRPGPYIYAEWPFGGVPERASKYARLDPEFLRMSRHYINAVSRIIVPHQITRGGTVILCQADNETYPELERCGTECGAFGKDGDFKDYLRKRYHQDISALNRAWKTDYADFSEPCLFFHETIVNTELPMAERLMPESPYRVRYYDSMIFIGDYAARLVGNVAKWLRENGIEVPLAANGWSPLYQNFKLMTDVVDLCGSDIYPYLYLEEERSNSVKDNWFYNVDIIKQQEADSSNGNAWSAEFESGTVMPEPQHHRFITLFAAVNGLKGLNYYMLVNRDNWCRGPINEWGREAANYGATKSAVSLLKKYEPWNCTIRNDFAVFTSKAHRVIDPGNFLTVSRRLKESCYTYCYFNPESADAPKEKTLLYAGGDWVFQSTADKLEKFVKNGGTLIAFNRFPHFDEFGNRLDIGFLEPDGVRPVCLPAVVTSGKKQLKLTHRGHLDVKVNLFYYKKLEDAEPVTLTLSRESGEILIQIQNKNVETFSFGYIRKIGKGRIIHLGCGADMEILGMVLSGLGMSPVIEHHTAGIDIALHEHRDGRKFISILNRSATPARPKLKISGADTGKLVHLEGKDTVRFGKEEFTLDIPGHEVEFWELLEK